ncbi:DgyrCDS14214 [Dimorphilus gyrociliatus]|uniref:Eukaryotic translation initiation factor 4 gamma 2 n=1 Tax=Dimorphilus gyrociliatus TaxID=2664684 RepID=A0A7I8WD97_9ANNE|nr:DgyrCDS14214 [Dimorphilus gyrociliatus]
MSEEQSAPFSQPQAFWNKRWVPPSSIFRESLSPLQHELHDFIFRKVRGILNKLTPQKFDKLSFELLHVGIDSQTILAGIILLTFKRLLLNKCQDEFENRRKDTERLEKGGAILTDEEMEELHIAKRKMLGNIKFICELGKLDMVHEGVLHKCIKQLLEKKKSSNVNDMVEDLECLCQIMKTVGRRLDTKPAKQWMNQYFDRIEMFMKSKELPPRVRFLLQDIVELRSHHWIPRESYRDNGPRTIVQVREEAARDGLFISNSSYSLHNSSTPINLVSCQARLQQERAKKINDLFHNSGPNSLSNFSLYSDAGIISNESIISKQMFDDSRNNHRMNNRMYNNQLKNNRNMGSRYQQRISNGDDEESNGSLQNGKDTVSLRPSGRVFNVLKPAGPTALPKSAQEPSSSEKTETTPTAPMIHKQGTITIRQTVKKVTNKQQVTETIRSIFTAVNDDKFAEIEKLINDNKCLKKFLDELIINLCLATIAKQNVKIILQEDREELLISVVVFLMNSSFLTSDPLQNALKVTLAKLEENENNNEFYKLPLLCANLLILDNAVLTLKNVTDMTQSSQIRQQFILNLFQCLVHLKNKSWLKNFVDSSNFDFKFLLNGADDINLVDILQERELDFLVPFLIFERSLKKKLTEENYDPNSLSDWVEENTDISKEERPKFVSVLVKCIMEYVTTRTSTVNGIDCESAVSKKSHCDDEKALLSSFKPVLSRFIGDDVELQKFTLYATQLFAYEKSFPKGLILRLFMQLYNEEIVEEDAFFQWKEEVNDEYPGKGQALFQVNQWLTWLEEAESEEEDEEEAD